MNDFNILFKALTDIMNIEINLYGYSFTISGLFIFFGLVALVCVLIGGLLK